MQVYLVGGAVRDALLGLPVKERDWVVVGGTRAALLQMNYREVGRDFPVFLHPDSHEEYALARLERKVAPGYRDRKSTRLNSSHVEISYAVFCLKKKKKKNILLGLIKIKTETNIKI